MKFYRHCIEEDFVVQDRQLCIRPKYFEINRDSDCEEGEWSFWYDSLHNNYLRTSLIVESTFVPEYSGTMRFSSYSDRDDEITYYEIQEYATSRLQKVKMLYVLDHYEFAEEHPYDFYFCIILQKLFNEGEVIEDTEKWDHKFIQSCERILSRKGLNELGINYELVNILDLPDMLHFAKEI